MAIKRKAVSSKKTASKTVKVVKKAGPKGKAPSKGTAKKVAAKPSGTKALVKAKKAAPPKKSPVPAKPASKVQPAVKKSSIPSKSSAKAIPSSKAKAPAPKVSTAKPAQRKPLTVAQPLNHEKPTKAAKSAPITKTPPTKANKKADVKVKAPEKPVDPDEPTIDPMDEKAKRIIKELEETMDLSRMRPRIQATTPKVISRAKAEAPLKLPEPDLKDKVKFQLELEFRCSPRILFNYLSDSSGLAGWFADEVQMTRDKVFIFTWEGGSSSARMVASRENQLVRYQWSEETDGSYFQFEIKEDDITADVALIITDFAYPSEKDSSIRLWESQVQKLRMLLGSA